MRSLFLVPIVLCLASWAGCSWGRSTCSYGAWPYDNQTQVPLDAIPQVQIPHVVSRLPSLAGGLQLIDVETGEGVPHTVAHVSRNGVQLVPDRPFEADREYEMVVLDLEAMDWTGFVPPESLWQVSQRVIRFHTAGVPSVVRAYANGRRAEIVLSEPVDRQTLSDALGLRGADLLGLTLEDEGRRAVIEASTQPTGFAIAAMETLSGSSLQQAPTGFDERTVADVDELDGLGGFVRGEYVCVYK